MKRLFCMNAALLAAALSAAAPALASSAGGEGHGSSLMPLFWQVFNFAVLVAILVYAMKKADVKGLLRDRSENIRKGIEDARAAREAAEAALAEVDERLRLKDQEIEKMVRAARASGEREREAAIKEGERLSRKIMEQARNNIQYELQQARAAIRAEAVELAMELARKKLGERLSAEEQRRLVEESLDKLEAGK